MIGIRLFLRLFAVGEALRREEIIVVRLLRKPCLMLIDVFSVRAIFALGNFRVDKRDFAPSFIRRKFRAEIPRERLQIRTVLTRFGIIRRVLFPLHPAKGLYLHGEIG